MFLFNIHIYKKIALDFSKNFALVFFLTATRKKLNWSFLGKDKMEISHPFLPISSFTCHFSGIVTPIISFILVPS